MKRMNSKAIVPFMLLSVAFLASCAKEKSYEEVFKEDVFTKSAISIDENDPYIYVPSTGHIPMNIESSRPFSMGDARLVTFRFTKDKLRVVEVPSDKRFLSERNLMPVLEFDIEHKDYRCAEDQFGECGNTEEEIDDRPWEKKRFFKVDFAAMETLETNTLPEQLDNIFGSCVTEEGTRVKAQEITKDAVNITLQKTYRRNLDCKDIRTWDDILNNNTYHIDYKFSFVKASSIASKDYKPFLYDPEDINTFGYFNTYLKKLGVDNAMTISSDKYLLNRWSPQRGEIVYYLSEDFYDADMGRVKDATIEAVNAVNDGLAKANSGLKIRLEDGRGKNEGDIRNSFIMLVKDPVAAGLLGYGPSVANPLTGEIVKANTMMFYGTTVQTISRTYEEMVRETRARAAAEAAAGGVTPAISQVNGQASIQVSQEMKDQNRAGKAVNQMLFGDLKQSINSHGRTRYVPTRHNVSGGSQFNRQPKIAELSREVRKAFFDKNRVYRPDLSVKKLKKLEDMSEAEIAKEAEMVYNPRLDHDLEHRSKRCYYHESYIDWQSAFQSAGLQNIVVDPNAKLWDELSESEKQKIIDAVLPKVWIPTLVHELGHNLGLRHNFNGSEDKDNYYTAQERRALGMSREATYSSVMDYSYSELNQLPVMGKYDIAALRFAYKEEVETGDGKVVALNGKSLAQITKEHNDTIKPALDSARTAAQQDAETRGVTGDQLELEVENAVEAVRKTLAIKEYQFCTDEHVAVNPGCNRFDEGSGLANIARHYVRAYKDQFDRRYKRRARLSFSGMNDDYAYMSSMQTFRGLRLFFEIYDRINGMYGGLPEETWNSIDFLKEIKEAAQVALDFYVEILQTPDVHCAAVNNESGQLAGIVPLKDITRPGGRALSCFDSEELGLDTARFTIVGETGQHVNHARGTDLRSDISADPSEMSVRGIWMDKVLAVRFLTMREFGISSFDDYRSNFLDYPQFREKAMGAILAFVSDESTQEAEFRMIDGSTMKIENTFNMVDTHKITESFNPVINWFLGLRSASTDFRTLVIPRVRKALVNGDDPTANLGLASALRAEVLRPGAVIDRNDYANVVDLKVSDATVRLAALPENAIANNLLKARTVRDVLTKLQETVPREVLIQIYMARSQGQVPAEIPEEMKPAYDVELEQLFAFLTGAMPSDKQIYETFLHLN